MARTVRVQQSVMASNEELALANRQLLDKAATVAVNLMASPGAGKTSLILATAQGLRATLRCGAVEGDIAGDLDATAIEAAGFPAVQVNTGGSCHLRAGMVAAALHELPLHELDVVFIENVGNLVCPAGVSLGEHLNVVLSSTPEGDDKPLKYPEAFRVADAVVITKWDLVEHTGFDLARYEGHLRRINSAAPLLRLSARTGEGLGCWMGWLRQQVVSRGM